MGEGQRNLVPLRGDVVEGVVVKLRGCVSDVEGASRAVAGSGTLLLIGVAALRCTSVMWFFDTARAASKELPTYSSFCTVVYDSQSASTVASKLARPAVTSVLVGHNGPMGRVSTPRDPQPCPWTF